MPQRLDIHENRLRLVFEFPDDQPVRLLHFSALPFTAEDVREGDRAAYRLVEVQATGENQHDHHGSKYTETSPGNRLRYVTHRDYRTAMGRKIEIEQQAEGLRVISHLQCYDDIAVVRCWTELINQGDTPLGIEYVSSFALGGLTKEARGSWTDTAKLHIPHNYWDGELQWRESTLPELGLYPVIPVPSKRLSYSVTGTWPSDNFLPMGIFENTESGTQLMWQIEAPGSWQWEIAIHGNQLYLKTSGPTERENHWWKNLAPGESFSSVEVAVSSVAGDIAAVVAELTRYRRAIRRPNADNESLAVIFNDYMNCLFGDPTTEKLFPLIDAAAEVGCEYFCIDCGWYADGGWWDGVGEWLPSSRRFPGGIEEPLNYIRQKGMTPGLWLEIEVMGINCPLAKRVPTDWFFQRHGKPVIDHGRYQLDFRNPEVVAHADRVIDRLVKEYGVGYIKMDYNINAGPGTERDADSYGDGLLEHNRAYLAWLDDVFVRYPDLVIENCGSGGLRMTYAFLSRLSVQSSSDQTDYRKYAVIAAASPTALTPEQCAVWSYPLRDGNAEEVIYNMVNAMLLRIHQSGHMVEISPEGKALVREGIAYYKEIRQEIATGFAFWPLGLPKMEDGWVSFGLRNENRSYLAVWRAAGSEQTCQLPLPMYRGKHVQVRVGYPTEQAVDFRWHAESGILTVTLPQTYMARLFQIDVV